MQNEHFRRNRIATLNNVALDGIAILISKVPDSARRQMDA